MYRFIVFGNAFFAYFAVLRKDITILSVCMCLPVYCLSNSPSPFQLLNQMIQIFTYQYQHYAAGTLYFTYTYAAVPHYRALHLVLLSTTFLF